MDKLPGHQDGAPDVDGEGFVDDGLGNLLDGVDALHVAVGGVVDEDVHLAELLQSCGVDLLDAGLVGNVAFQDQILCAHFVQSALDDAGVSSIGGEVAVHAVAVDFAFVIGTGEPLVHQHHLGAFSGESQGGGCADALGIVGSRDDGDSAIQSIIDHTFLTLQESWPCSGWRWRPPPCSAGAAR